MKTKQLQRVGIGLGIVLLFLGCDPELEADLYVQDILDVVETGNILEIPVRLGMPIASTDDCEEDKNKMLPALERYGIGTKFISCKSLDDQMYDLLEVEMNAQIVVQSDKSSITVFKGMFGILLSEVDDGSINVRLVKTDNVEKAMSQIGENYPFQDTTLSGFNIRVYLRNDLRTPVRYEIDSSFVDNNPVDEPTVFELDRRGVIEIVPSNVRALSILKNGSAKFGRLLKGW